MEHQQLLSACKVMTTAELKSMMKVSDKISKLNYDRFQNFEDQPLVPACWGYDGPAHQSFNIASLDSESQAYAQESIITLSALYGCLRPKDAIRPYRLEMGAKLTTSRGKNLYEFWGDSIVQELNKRIQTNPENSFVINIASEEYWKVIENHRDILTAPVYTIRFPGSSVWAKQARGSFARFLCDHKVRHPSELTKFTDWSQEHSECAASYQLVESSTDGFELTFQRIPKTKITQNELTKSTKKRPSGNLISKDKNDIKSKRVQRH